MKLLAHMIDWLRGLTRRREAERALFLTECEEPV